jgi:hypothetical protein
MEDLFLQQLTSQANDAIAKREPRLAHKAWTAAAPHFAAAMLAAPPPPPPLEPLMPSALGNFPYYWQDPSNLLFNFRTYNWISANLRANTPAAQLDVSFFTNLYAGVLSKISYLLSSSDLARLRTAAQASVNQQRNVLNAWQALFGSAPPSADPLQPIDILLNTVTASWASPPVTLLQMQQAADLETMLNRAPPNSAGVLQALASYLQVLGSTVELQAAASMYRGYLAEALLAAQSPTANNGGLTVSNHTVNPAYAVTPSVTEILSGLNTPDAGLQMSVVVNRTPAAQYSLAFNGGAPTVTPSLGFLAIAPPNPLFGVAQQVEASAGPVRIEIASQGLTLVHFGPTPYDPASGRNWYWMTPLLEAIRNGNRDVSGFRFSPDPQTDFNKSGPFGFLTTVAITKHPSIAITSMRPDYRAFQLLAGTTRRQINLSLASQPLGAEPPPTHTMSVNVDRASQSVTVQYDPLADPGGAQSTAFVVGVSTCYPATT